MRIAWIYEDDEYNERLLEYVRCNNEITFRISVFQQYSDFVSREDKFDFVFLEFIDIPQAKLSYPAEKLVCISNNNDSCFGDFLHLNIYQNIDKLFHDINFILNDRKYVKFPVEIHREKAIITAIYSASGGAGKTIFSKHISEIYKEQNEKVLLVNLELYSGNLKHLGEPSLSELLLLIKLNEKFSDPIPLNKFTITLNEIEIIPSFLHPSDALNITENDIISLISLLSPLYDRIVFDLDVELSPRVIAVLNNCDELIEVMQNHDSGMNKHLNLMTMLDDINVSHKHRLFIPQLNTAFLNENEYLTEVREWYRLQI